MKLKERWLKKLNRALSKLSKQERAKVIEFYREMIDDKIESGESEISVIEKQGDPTGVAKKILTDNGIEDDCINENICKKIVSTAKKMPLWATLTIGFFAVVVGLPIVIGLGAGLFSLVVTFWAVFGAMVGVSVGCAIATLPAIVMGIGGFVGNGFALVGACILGCGVCMLLAVGFWYLSICTTQITVYICKKLSKGGKKHEKN